MADTRARGFVFNDTHIYRVLAEVTGMAAVAVPLRRSDGRPAGAIHVTAITSRLSGSRRDKVVTMIREEYARLEEEIRPLLDVGVDQNRLQVS